MNSPIDKAHRRTSPFGPRILDGFHNGYDLVASDGKYPTAILCPVDGSINKIKKSVPDSHTGLSVKTDLEGNYVWVKTAAGYVVKFHHLKANSIPSNYVVGGKLKIGDFIGLMGSTGQSSAVHLHYEFRDPSNKSFDPEPYINTPLLFPAISAPSPSTAASPSTIKAGDKIKILPTAKTYAGTTATIPDKHKNVVYTVQQVNADRVLVKELFSWVFNKDFVKV